MQELIADRYEVEDIVGTGGMSTVYCALDKLLERRVALKILHEQFGRDDEHVERFLREARAVARLSHPNIVTVIDRGEEDGRQFIVFELVEGENLKELVARGGPLPVRRVLELGLEIGRALSFAHAEGLIHRDVKPQNVLLNTDGLAKVTDFGIVRTLDAVGQTETGTVLGTSHYIAPEQARGERVDAQTDVYSFGVVLYELLAGEVPYPGDNFLTVAMKHVNEPVPSVLDRRPDTPLRLASLIERCMAKVPAERPRSMDVVVSELESVRAELDAKDGGDATMIIKARPAQTERPQRRHAPRRRIPLWPLLAGLLLLAAIVGGVLLATRDDGGQPGAAAAAIVHLRGVASYDPQGDDKQEHPEDVAKATDGDPATYWTTSTYEDFSSTKDGVGLVLDAGSKRKVKQIAVTTDTPGYSAEIQAGGSPQGPFTEVGGGKTVGASTTWDLGGADARYYVLWITDLDGKAHVSEVKATG
ncbi:MAG TPA: protein kinase [Gaiellaceae bacterium]|nr:protein kinase [Gaiellaceae bacterium]